MVLWRMNTYRRRSLGATARKGSRTGAITISREGAHKIASSLVKQLVPCAVHGPSATRRTPTPDEKPYLFVPEMPVRDIATGHKRPVEVIVYRSQFLARDRLATGAYVRALPETPDETFSEYIRLDVNAQSCADPTLWHEDFYSVLTHEAAHAADPKVRLRTNPYQSTAHPCTYVKRPTEVTARIAQARAELTSPRGRATIAKERQGGHLQSPADLLNLAPAYKHFRECWEPEHRRRFLKMAAHLWASLRF